MEILTWKDKVDGQDDILAEDINSIANYANKLNEGKIDKVAGKGLSTNDYTDEDKEKLYGIEEGANKTVVDAELSSTSTNPVQNKVIKNNIENLEINKANAIENSASGEFIQLTDSADSILRELNIYGKTTQINTTGKNLFDSNVDNWQSFTINSYTRYGFVIPSGLTEIVVSAKLRGSYISAVMSIYSVNEDGSYTLVASIPTPETSNAKAITLDASQEYIMICVSTSSLTSVKIVINAYYWQMEEGTTATEYEPYTGGVPVPSPDNPQELNSICDDGNVNLISCRKNLFDVFNQTFTSTNYRCTTEVLEDGTLRLTNAKLSAYSAASCLLPYSVSNFVGKTITISFKTNCSNEDLYAGSVMKIETNDGDSGTNILGKYNYGSSTITISKAITEQQAQTYERMKITFYTNATDSAIGEVGDYVDFTDIQIEISDTETEFEAYKGNTLTFSTPNGLKGIPVSSDGNYTDADGQQWICDEVDFEKGVYVQRIGEYVVTGTEDWLTASVQGSTVGYVRYDATVLNVVGVAFEKVLSTHYLYNGANPAKSEGVWGLVANDGNSRIRLRIVSRLTSAEEFKNYLVQQYENNTPIKICYALYNPIETPLTDEEIAAYKALKTYKPVTNVVNGENAYMKVDYAADTKTYIDNKFAELQAMILEG